ncbi:MAG: PAS domain S-box protein [Anaerolineales bacterium]|nr:PAS domain S-box protein [Anaerolineales bacterium]
MVHIVRRNKLHHFFAGLVLSLLRTQVNARRIAEELTIELKESEEKYSIIFNNEMYAICIFDLETLQLLEVNQAYERVYGYSREELLSGMTIHDITAEHQASNAATVKATLDGTTFIPLRYHRKKDGTVFPVEIVGGPYVWRNRKVMFALAHDITDRKKDEQEIRKLGRAVEQSPASIVITGTDGAIEYVNPKFTEITGYTLAEAAGSNPRILKSGYTTEQEYRLLWDTITSGNQWQGEFQNKRKNGELYWEKATIAPVWNDLGQITNFLAIKEDITQRKQAEQALLESEKFYRSLFENMNGFAYCQMLFENGKPSDFIYLMVNKAFETQTGLSNVINKRVSEIIPNIRESDPGLIETYGRVAVTGRSESFEIYLRTLKMWFSVFVYSPSPGHFVAVFDVITERKRLEEKLAESQIFLNNIIEHSPTSLWVSDEHGTLIRMNQACRDVLHVHDEEVVGKYNILNDNQINAQGYMPRVRNVFEKGETARFLMTYNTADIHNLSLEQAVRVVLDVNISAIRDSYGKITNAIIQHVNITQLDGMEKELRQSEERYRLLATTIPEPIFLHQEGRFIFVNNAALKLFGAAKPEDLLGTPIIDRVHPAYRQIVMDRVGRSGDKDSTLAMIEEVFLQLDGSPVNVEVAGNRLVMNGKPTMQVVAHDITERKKMMDTLRESEQRYREPEKPNHCPGWKLELNLNTQEVTWSDEMYRIFGIDKYSYTGRLGDVIRKVIHPDDLHVVLPTNARTIASEKPIEYRILLPNKITRHIWAKAGDVIIDGAGNPVLMTGIAQDITEQAGGRIQTHQQLGNVRKVPGCDRHAGLNCVIRSLTQPFTKSSKKYTAKTSNPAPH